MFIELIEVASKHQNLELKPLVKVNRAFSLNHFWISLLYLIDCFDLKDNNEILWM
jgi:hypothetical protein